MHRPTGVGAPTAPTISGTVTIGGATEHAAEAQRAYGYQMGSLGRRPRAHRNTNMFSGVRHGDHDLSHARLHRNAGRERDASAIERAVAKRERRAARWAAFVVLRDGHASHPAAPTSPPGVAS